MDFYQWLIYEKKLSKTTASKYNLVIKNRISEWLPSYEIPKNSIEFEALKQTIFSLEIYQERNRTGNNMYSSALRHYGCFLQENVLEGLPIFNENQEMTSEAQKLVKVRITQNKFRKSLFELYPYCAISGFNQAKFLIASHIKPWALSDESERIDPYNGFLLTPNFDRLFDTGYISFRSNGEIILSKYLKSEAQSFFNIPDHIKIPLSHAHKPYLEFYTEEVFQK